MSAGYAYLHRSEVFVLGEVVLTPGTDVGITCSAPCESFDELYIEVCLGIEVVVVIVEDVESSSRPAKLGPLPARIGVLA